MKRAFPLFLFVLFTLSLVSCETVYTDHMLTIQDAYGIKKGSLVVDEDMNEIGEVTEVVYEAGHGHYQFLKIDEEYLQYPAAEFMVTLNRKGESVIMAYYPE